MATVKGTFDLNARPASSGLRKIREEAGATQKGVERLGGALDNIYGVRAQEKMKQLELALKGRKDDLDEFAAKAREVSQMTITPEVDLSGIARANEQLDLLEMRLRRLSGRSYTTTVRTRYAGAGPLGAAAHSAGAALGAGGRGVGGGMPSALGLIGRNPLLSGGIALGLPAATTLLGGGGALLGSASAAGLGAGTLGLGAAGAAVPLATAGLGIAKPAITGVGNAMKALEQYNAAVAVSGRNSTQAQSALSKLNTTLHDSPHGTLGLAREVSGFEEDWKKLTRPGQASFLGGARRFLGDLHPAQRQIAGIDNRFMRALAPQADRFGRFLGGDVTSGFLGAAGRTADKALPDTERTLRNVLATFMNLSRAAMPFFREALHFVANWTGGWASSSSNIEHTRRQMGQFVSQLKSWGRLGGAAFRLLRDIISPGARPGQSMVDDLTKQLNQWDRWAQRNPDKLRQFFRESAHSTERIATALGHAVGAAFKLGRELRPLLDQVTRFVDFLASSGLLSAGGIPLLAGGYGAIRGFRNRWREQIRGGGAGGGVAPAGGAPLFMPIPGGVRGRTVPGTRSTLGGAMGRSETMAAERALAAEYGHTGLAYAARSRLGGLRAALPGRLAAGARGFAADFLPFYAISAGMQGLSTPGGFNNRVQGTLSAATFGAIPSPMSTVQRESLGAQQAAAVAHQYGLRFGGGVSGLRRQEAALSQHIAGIDPTAKGFLQQPGFGLFTGITGTSMRDSLTKTQLAEVRALRQAQQSVQMREAQASMTGIQGAFGIRVRGGQSQRQALRHAMPDIAGELRHLHGQSSLAFGNMTASWLENLKEANPKLKHRVDDMLQHIVDRLNATGHQVKLINGQILDTSRKQWNNIADALVTPQQRALQETKKNFTAIEKQAVAALINMGYSPSQAKTLVMANEQSPGAANRAVRDSQIVGQQASAALTRHASAGTLTHGPHSHHSSSGGHAMGGRLAGAGNRDTLALGAGHYGAPGELVVHGPGEARANQLLRERGVPMSLEQIVGGAHLPHYHAQPRGGMGGMGFWGGGRMGSMGSGGQHARRGGGGANLGGHPRPSQPVVDLISLMQQHYPSLGVTATTDGSHVSGSYHYRDGGEAVDLSGSTGVMHQASAWIKRSGLYRQLAEGIHNPNLSVSQGKLVPASTYSAVWAGHADHIHLAIAHALRGGNFGAGSVGAGGVGGHGAVSLTAPGSSLSGVPGSLSNAASSKYAYALEHLINAKTGGRPGGGGGLSGSVHGIPHHGQLNKKQVEELWIWAARKYGGGSVPGRSLAGQMASIASAESGYDTNAKNPSGATGLWQILGALAPGDLTDAYVNAHNAVLKYKTQGLGAWAASKGVWGHARGGRVPVDAGWFGRGGSFLTPPGRSVVFGAGESGQERVTVTPAGRKGGGGDIHFTVSFGDVHVRNQAHAKTLAKEFAREAVKALHHTDGVPEGALSG